MDLTASQRARLAASRDRAMIAPVEGPVDLELRRLGLVKLQAIRPSGVRVELTPKGRVAVAANLEDH